MGQGTSELMPHVRALETERVGLPVQAQPTESTTATWAHERCGYISTVLSLH